MPQSDVILISVTEVTGEMIPHLTLAEGEVTGHKHRITDGKAELFNKDGTLYLRVICETALLSHEEHHAVKIPQGHWIVKIQREYEAEGWLSLIDNLFVNAEERGG